jgi:hypothetical protein
MKSLAKAPQAHNYILEFAADAAHFESAFADLIVAAFLAIW